MEKFARFCVERKERFMTFLTAVNHWYRKQPISRDQRDIKLGAEEEKEREPVNRCRGAIIK